MNKTLPVVVLLILAGISSVQGEAPELRNVMPNSWKKLIRLSPEEIEDNKSLLKETGEIVLYKRNVGSINFAPDYFFVYKQSAGTDWFYRIIYTNNPVPNFTSFATSFWQFLVFNGRILFDIPYNGWMTGRYTYGVFVSIDIIMKDPGTIRGILITELLIRRDEDDYSKWGESAYRKRQLCGTNRSRYYLMEDIIARMAVGARYDEFYWAGWPCLDIEASQCLVDPNTPLRYSLQNAFDGDPATSYVENTEDDLMEFDFTYATYEKIKETAIINGYAQNQSLYIMNNRIKSIGIETLEWNEDRSYLVYVLKSEELLRDNFLSYQVFDVVLPSKIKIKSIYSGSKYNDTCIAELNIETDSGWLFGDLNE
jgi:hypothetical protein